MIEVLINLTRLKYDGIRSRTFDENTATYFLVEVAMQVIFHPMHLIEVILVLAHEEILQRICSMLKWMNLDELLHLYL